jgi:hypothetical protein
MLRQRPAGGLELAKVRPGMTFHCLFLKLSTIAMVPGKNF